MFVNGVLSDELPLNAGVPQGSVLGPLLFLIYINDIADKLLGKTSLYADDISLNYSSSELAQIETVLNNDLKKLKEWAFKWLINFYPAKTKVILVSNIFQDYDLRLTYDDTVLILQKLTNTWVSTIKPTINGPSILIQ